MRDPNDIDDEEGDITVEGAFKVFDELIKNGTTDVDIPNIAVAGGQSVGKSSLLSLLLNVLLWSDEGTSTHGVTQIHSRRSNAEFSAEVFIEYDDPELDRGVPKKVKFASTASPEDLSQILHWAGDEARRTKDGARPIRSYAELQAMGEGERTKEKGNWEKYTRNVVILHVSGIEQPNLSIVDLPGLVTGHGGRDITTAVAERYLRKNNTLILLCVAAGGSDAESGPVDQLVNRCDPDGERTLGIITKADMIQSEESSFIALIKGNNENLLCQPQFGWWPVRLRTRREFKQQIGLTQFGAIQERLFNEELWRDVARETGRDFAWRTLKATINTEFERLMRDSMSELQKRVRKELADVRLREKELGPEIADPCGVLFNMIDDLREELRRQLKRTWEPTHALLILQRQLYVDIQKCIPEFKLEYVGNRAENDDPRVLFLDELHRRLIKTGNARMGEPDKEKVRYDLILKYTASWEDLCIKHSDQIWAAMEAVVSDVVNKVCKTERVKEKLIAAIKEHIIPYREQAEAYIREHAADERANPSYTDGHVDSVYQTFKLQDTYIRQFINIFRPEFATAKPPSPPSQASTSSGHTPLTPPTSRRSSQADVVDSLRIDLRVLVPPPTVTPREWNKGYAYLLLGVAASLTQHLSWSAKALGRDVGRKLQILLQECPKTIGGKLREALKLNVDQAGVKFARKMTTDELTENKRRKLVHDRTTWETIDGFLNA